MPNAIITGASSGLGRALARELADRGYSLTIDARHAGPLEGRSPLACRHGTRSRHRRGRVTSPIRSTARSWSVPQQQHGPIDLLVNNASELGGSPQPALRDLTPDVAERLWRTNVDAPLQLIRTAWPHLAPGAVIMNISSDAAVEHYEGWGGYAATKAALDHLTLTLAAEEPRLLLVRRRSGRHAHADAPGGLSGGGHLRSPGPGERWRPRLSHCWRRGRPADATGRRSSTSAEPVSHRWRRCRA